MEDYRLGAVETRFAELIWTHAPVSSGALVKLAAEELQWKKSTTYTVLKKLCGRGLFENRDGTVTVRMTREVFCGLQSRQFVAQTFGGSLPAFVAAFTRRQKLTPEEIRQLKQLIEGQEADHG